MTNEQLVKWRKSKKLTQKEACALLNTPLRTYVGWEIGEARIPGVVDMFVKISQKYEAK